MKKSLIINSFISFLLIAIGFLVSNQIRVVFADTACDPYSCASQNAYFRVDSCVFQTSGCGINTYTNYAVYNCSNDGTPGSCKGPTPGRLGCILSNPYTTCDCSNDPSASGSCTGPGQSCGSYNGMCVSCVNHGTCSVEQTSTLGCCLVTSTPTPTPSLWCGDGVCSPSINETCTNCQTDCGVCNPPPTGPYCGDGTCNGGETQSTCCTDCGTGACTGTPSCSVSLSPSTVSMYTDDNPFNLTANVSNLQNGNVSQVQFSVSNNSVAINPVFDTSAPWQTQITPQNVGTATLTAQVYMGGSTVRCSATATVNVSVAPPGDEAPDCDAFTVLNPSVTGGTTAQYQVVLSDTGNNLLADGGFESGNMSYWSITNQVSEWWAVPNYSPGGWPSPGAEGTYYAKVSPQLTADDAYVATGWIQAGENLTNQNYTLEFIARSHSYTDNINRIFLQREPYLGDWAGGADISNKILTVNSSGWTKWSNAVTWPNPGNGTNTSRFRVVLRPAPIRYGSSGPFSQPVYYDSVKAYKTNQAGINPSTVRFYRIPTSANPCVGSNWTLIGTGTRVGTTTTYTMNWNTTGVPSGEYIVAVNANDIQGNQATGNPGNCGTPGFTFRPACNGPQTVTACVQSCTEDCGTGVTLAQQPTRVNSVTVSNMASGRLNLSQFAPPVQINWSAATISSPATINRYDIWVFPQGSAAPANGATTCSGCQQLTAAGTATSRTYTPQPAQTDEVAIYVRAVNSSPCGNVYGNWSPVRNVDYVANVSGTIYDLSTGPNGLNNCSGSGTAVNIAAANPSISTNIGGSTANPGSTYSLTNVPYAPSASWADHGFNVSLTLNNPDPANSYFCNCPGGTPFLCTQTDTASPATAQNFFVSAVDLSNGPWWQTTQGNIYAANSYTSLVPDSCDLSPSCNANLITWNSSNDNKSAGAPLSGGNIEANGYYTEYNGSTQPRGENTSHENLVREDYDYLIREVDTSNTQTVGSNLTTIPNNGTIYGDDNTQVFYRNGNLTLNFTGTQTVAAGTKKIFFVNGNITFNNGSGLSQLINVEQGGYIAFIASENITFANTIGNVMTYPSGGSLGRNIAGVFVADNQIIVADDGNDATKDRLFVGEGTFVGWNGIDLQRTYDNTTSPLDRALNNTYPTEIFHFRPDFNENTPEIMLEPNLVWQEVN